MLRSSLLVAIALVVVMGGSAVARPGPIRVESKAKTVAPAKEELAVVECEGKQKALGGGFKSAEGSGFAQVYPEVSRPDRGNSWHVRVANSSFSESRRFRAYAICQRNPGPLKRVLESEDAPDDANPTHLSARCPGADQVVGGGFAVAGDGEDFNSSDGTVVRSYPLADEDFNAWQLSFDPIGPDLRIRAIAVCRERGPGLRMETKFPVAVGPLQTKTVEVGCSARRPHVVNGGFSTQGTLLIPISSYPTLVGDAWVVTVANPSGGSSANFRAWGLCQ
jgi:hypothetical protein